MTVQTTHPTIDLAPQQFGTVVQSEATALRGLDDWLRAAGSAEQLARQLVHSFFVPQAYKVGNPRDEQATAIAVANATGAILLGQSLGLDPLTALQQIYVVHGRPGMYAKLKVALAQAAGHRVWDEEYSAETATVCGVRRGTDDVVRITITMEQAKQAGWISNAAYQKTPADMLWARAASRVVDRIAADLLMGIQSIEDIDPDDTTPAARVAQVSVEDIPKPSARTGALAALPTRTLDQPPAAKDIPADVTPESDGITDAQLRKLGAVMGDLWVIGAGSRDRRLAIASRIAGRSLSSSKDLSQDEASIVIDTLDSIARADDAAVRLDRLERGLPGEPTAAAEAAEAAEQHAATIDAQHDADQAQAEQVGSIVDGGWPA